MRRRKLFLWTLAAIGLYAILGFFALPPLVKSVLVKQLTERLHRQTEIQKIKINPFLLTVEVEGLLLKDRDGVGPFVSFDRIYLDLEAISLFKNGPVLREIHLSAPHFTLIRNDDLTYNFSDLLDEFGSKSTTAESSQADSRHFLFSLNNIRIEHGSIDFEDRPKHGHHRATDITIAIPFISNLPYYLDVYVHPVFQAKFNGTPVSLAGKTKPFIDSRETSLDINISNFELPKYLEYLPVEIRFTMPSGNLDTKLSLSFTEYRNKPPALLLRGMLALNKLSVRDLDSAPLLDLPLLAVVIESADVFSKKVNLRSVLLQSPELSLRREKDGRFNLQSLVPEIKGGAGAQNEKKATKSEAAPPRFEVAEIRLTDGKISFTDRGADTPFRTTLEALDVVASHVSNVPKESAAVDVSFATDAGEMLKQTGTFTLEPLAAQGTVQLQGVPVKRYAPYYGSALLFEVEDGLITASTRYQYAQETGRTMLSGLVVSLKSFRLKRKGDKQNFLKVPVVSVKNTDIDLAKRSVLLGEVTTKKGTVVVRRQSDGTVNLAKLLAAPRPISDKGPSPGAQKEAAASPWLIVMKKLAVDRYAVIVEDQLPVEPTKIVADPVSIAAENVSTAKNSKGTATLRVALNKSALFSAAGSIGLDPLAVNFELDLKDLELMPLQPYFTERINILVTSGAVSLQGNVVAITNADKATTASFNGNVSLTKLTTIDKVNSEDFLKWDSLSVSGIQAANNPLQVQIKDISLTDFYSRLIVNDNGTLNVQGIFEKEAPAPEKTDAQGSQHVDAIAQEPSDAAQIRIENITLQGGDVSFSDHYVKPNYSAKLTELGGRISGLSSEESEQADVDVRGQLGNGAPLQIAGKINPLSKDLFVDLQVDFKDIDLSPMTPYSGKYAGYTIEKGKLTLQLKYLIASRKLEATNRVLLDQFTFGDKVDSPSATKLPVRFAVSLLKDRNGTIDLDLPVTESLDDPQFSIWGVILQVMTNLLTKAATSPFALLGSLAGGGHELSYVEFEYGTAHLEGQAEEKLQKLGKVLFERPALKLDVTGRVDMEKDQEGLRQRRFERKLKVQKLHEIVKKGGTTASVDDITIEPGEYAKYLTLAYKKETFPKPLNFLGMAKDLPGPEMEKLILSHIEITEEDVRDIGLQRAQGVKEYLLKTGKIEPERIFLVTATTSPEEKKDKLKESRVDFVIK